MRTKIVIPILMIITIFTSLTAQSRFGISLAASRAYWVYDDQFNTKNKMDIGIDGELEFFIGSGFSYFLSSAFYKYEERLGEYDEHVRISHLCPVLNGLKLQIGNLYIGLGYGFLMREIRYELPFISQDENKKTYYFPNQEWILGYRINLSEQTSFNLFLKYYTSPHNQKFWSWGIGLGPSH